MEYFIVAFMTFFATIGPLDVAAVFAALTARYKPREARKMAVKGILISISILLLFALSGEWLLSQLGISLAALRAGGGILLLLIGIDMVFARTSGGTSTTADEEEEAITREDISVFPLATPLIAGPGSMGASILLMANAEGHPWQQGAVLLALAAILLLTLVMLLAAAQIQRILGVTGMHVITRVFGVLLTALAVQFIFDGVVSSGVFSGKAATETAEMVIPLPHQSG
ncbi:MarC family protein [Teredinibacter turnerae]|uniref:MarC family protein n=1 Tax=Teredinibacter turnerae TaxID=2426 RepID=UPI00036983FB|nr:MarC family protein [Teredinibacter turnerae]